LTGNNLFMSLDAAALENIDFPNNIFENVNLSPKYGGQAHAQALHPTGQSTNKRGGGRHRTIQAHF